MKVTMWVERQGEPFTFHCTVPSVGHASIMRHTCTIWDDFREGKAGAYVMLIGYSFDRKVQNSPWDVTLTFQPVVEMIDVPEHLRVTPSPYVYVGNPLAAYAELRGN